MRYLPDDPVINSPYAEPCFHWGLDEAGLPTGEKQDGRRRSFYMIPVPAARRARFREQGQLELDEGEATQNDNANRIRGHVAKWRNLPGSKWNVTDATARLLRYWREDRDAPKPFFCQTEAAETLIWLAEVAPHTDAGRKILRDLREANEEANPGLSRFAAKMATGSGKTTVMAMMIAYHAINKARYPSSPAFCANFLLITPGITIRDRLRVLLPQDPDNYYQTRGIVPPDMLADVQKARVVITNFQALARRETRKMPPKARARLQGNDPKPVETKETPGRMLNRICPEILRAGEAIVINDEAHHCYRHKDGGGKKMTGDEREEARKHEEAARLWISGIEALNERIAIRAIYDLSATPFFLAGSGYREGQMFPWVVSDFPLMEAIESGIVKVPRVPTEDATIAGKAAGGAMPVFRDLYRRISGRLPKRGRGKQGGMNPDDLPAPLMAALQALYSNYEETSAKWEEARMAIPPVFIIICNNTSTSKLVYDYVAGYAKGGGHVRGKFPLLDNIGDDGKPLARPRTLLIDSYQLESGGAMDAEFKQAAAGEIALFKDEFRKRYRGARDAGKLTDEDLLREVMNTVGKEGKLGEQIRCVVSVSMLTEGWDTSNVTHILGVRAFGTQLLCEQVVGRGLRRVNYQTENGMLRPEYANIFGVPFSFVCAGEGAVSPPQPVVRVRHLEERNHLAISFPRVRGYKIKPPESRLTAKFDKNSRMVIDANNAPAAARVEGIVGKSVMMTLDDMKKRRENEVVYFLAAYTARHYYADSGGNVPPSRFRDLVPIVREWLGGYLTCLDGTFPQYLLWAANAKVAAANIHRACTTSTSGETLLPVIDPFTPEGATHHVDFMTSKKLLHNTRDSHINIAACDSRWEMDFCRLLEDDAGVFAYSHSAGLGFVVPYEAGKEMREYHPDFIVLADDGKKTHDDDWLHLVVEIKGYRTGKAQAKADTMNRLWVPAVNNDGRFGRWAFEEIMDPQDAKKILAKHTGGGV